MDRHHKSLENEELYFQCGEMIKNNIVAIKKQISTLRDFLGNRRKKILEDRSSIDDKNKIVALQSAKAFYEQALTQLVQVEEICEEHLMGMKLNLLNATMDRLQLPTRVSMAQVRKAYELCMLSGAFEQEPLEMSCQCIWTNVPRECLEETRNILLRPKMSAPSQFDESDLKFKQEMTVLRTKMFRLPKRSNKSPIREKSNNDRFPSTNGDFIGIARSRESFTLPSIENEFFQMSTLKFVNEEFVTNDLWTRTLDDQGNQLNSKWHFALRPQIEKLMKKRRITVLHFNPRKMFELLSAIPENGMNFVLLKEDLLPSINDKAQAFCLKSWRPQFQAIDGRNIAATLIQALWRGYWLRKEIWESERRYIAASIIWFSWTSLKRKREMQERYLMKMLISLHVTRDLSLQLSNEIGQIIKNPHVVIHIPSLGYPLEIRRTFLPRGFTTHQNMTSLRISMVRNPQTEVIYVLPVKATADLLTMYSDVVEAVCPAEDVAKRITFIALSQAETFRNRPLNVARILHCSEDSLREIRKKIADKSAYFLPWIVDECDMRLAGNFGVPLLSPDMELQQKYTNMSTMAEIVERIGVLQPPHRRDIKDYGTLCTALAELIVVNTEVCVWQIKLNYGSKVKHYAIFLINHISIPFMPILRREREKHGDEWMKSSELRKDFLDSLMKHLPKVLSTVTRMPHAYNSWKEFYVQVQKFGALLQALPFEKNATIVISALFVPGLATGKKPKWNGTADRILLESRPSTYIYMMPQTSVDTSKLKPIVNKLAEGIQREGYFGYLTIDCYCYPHKYEDKLMVVCLNIHPYYSYLQSYLDWIQFAVDGSYSYKTNTFNANVLTHSQTRKKRTSYLLPQRIPQWSETMERYGIVISYVYHTGFSDFSWLNLKAILDKCGIVYNAKRKEGVQLILHDGETRHCGMMVIITSSMTTTMSVAQDSLKKLHRAIALKLKKPWRSNLLNIAEFFSKLSLDYENLAAERCE